MFFFLITGCFGVSKSDAGECVDELEGVDIYEFSKKKSTYTYHNCIQIAQENYEVDFQSANYNSEFLDDFPHTIGSKIFIKSKTGIGFLV